MEQNLVKLFSAGLMTIGSAGFGLPIPLGAITRSPELMDMIVQDEKIGHLKPQILKLAENLKTHLAAGHHTPDVIDHHVKAIPVILERHRPDAVEVRSAIETFKIAKSAPGEENLQPVRALLGQIISQATVEGMLVEHSLGAALITDVLESLFTILITHQDDISPLRPIFIKYHTSAQISHANSAMQAATETHRTKPLWAAVEAFELAQQIQAEDMVPESWAKLQNDKGAAIGMIAERSGDPIKLRQAMDMLSTAAAIWNRDLEPVSWAETETNLGNAGWLLGLMENQPELLRTSFRKLQAAHAVYADQGLDHETRVIHANLERMLTMIRKERKIA